MLTDLLKTRSDGHAQVPPTAESVIYFPAIIVNDKGTTFLHYITLHYKCVVDSYVEVHCTISNTNRVHRDRHQHISSLRRPQLSVSFYGIYGIVVQNTATQS